MRESLGKLHIFLVNACLLFNWNWFFHIAYFAGRLSVVSLDDLGILFQRLKLVLILGPVLNNDYVPGHSHRRSTDDPHLRSLIGWLLLGVCLPSNSTANDFCIHRMLHYNYNINGLNRRSLWGRLVQSEPAKSKSVKSFQIVFGLVGTGWIINAVVNLPVKLGLVNNCSLV